MHMHNMHLCYLLEVEETRIVIIGYSGVSRTQCESVRRVVEEFYAALSEEYRRRLDFVEIHVYSDSNQMNQVLGEEALRIGVEFAATYTVMHEAWTGIPRIHIPADIIGDPGRVFRALLIHELFHAILHGRLDYYIVSSSTGYDYKALAILAAAYKDVEVYRAMTANGFLSEVRILAEVFAPREASHCLADFHEFCAFFKDSIPLLILGEENYIEHEKCRHSIRELYQFVEKLVENNTLFQDAVLATYSKAITLFHSLRGEK